MARSRERLHELIDKMSKDARLRGLETSSEGKADVYKLLLDTSVQVHKLVQSQQMNDIDFKRAFWQVGRLATQKVPLGPWEMADLLIYKGERYGDACITKWGPFGVWLRLDSKIERLKNMTENEIEDVLEPIQDTWADILGYAVLGYMICKGEIQ